MLAKRAASILVLLPVLFFIAQVQVPLAEAQASGAPFPYESPVMRWVREHKHVHHSSAAPQHPGTLNSPFLTTPPMYAAGANPLGLAIGDFDGDGNKDVIVATDPPVLLLGNGDGTLQAAVTIPTIPTGGTGVAVGDFNGDGKLDVVFAISGGAVVYLGNGNGTFGAGMTFSSGGTNEDYLANVLVADVNGDGILDLVLNTDAGVSALFGNGSGGFGAPVISSVGSVQAMGAAKFNQDSYLDLAVTGANGLSILLGNGAGGFATHGSYLGSGGLAISDFNRDGFQDVALSGGQLFLGNGDGTLRASGTFPTALGPVAVATVDFNGDGIPDLITIGPDVTQCWLSDFGTTGVALGNGDGTFQPVTIFDSGGCSIGHPYPTIAIGDLNNDGAPDAVVVSNFPAELSVLVNKANGTFPAAILTVEGGGVPLVVADFNGDGNSDVAMGENVYLSDGAGGLVLKTPLDGAAAATGDFNHDGKADIVGYGTEGLLIFLGNGDGTFQPPMVVSSSPTGSLVAVADFNNDGNLDIAVVGSTVSIFLGNGSGTFTLASSTTLPSGTPSSVVAGDFNNDGFADLAFGFITGFDELSVVNVLLGKGNGSFQPPTAFNPGFGSITGIAALDFNNDGILDLAFAYGDVCGDCDGHGGIYYGDGDGTFSYGSGIGDGASPASIVAADFFGVGSPTAVMANVCDDQLDCPGGSITIEGTAGPTDIMLLFLGVGDFNNDGKPDLVGSLQFDAGASVLLNVGAALAASATTLSPASIQTHLDFQPVTFTALVQHTGPETPTGTVQFLDGGVLVGTGTVNSSGKASLTTTSLGVGAHFIVAYYKGDSNFAPSNSLGAHVTITRTNSETQISSSVNPSQLDEPVTFTARIVALFGNGETGTVTFYDGLKKIGSGRVSGGKATFTTRALVAGTHQISAVYSGDANFQGSCSKLLAQVVK